MKKIIFFAFCFALAFSFGVKAYAAKYYVASEDPNASDSNPGSENYPWLTLNKATGTAVAGDTVVVKAGTYIDISAKGSYPYPAFNPSNNGLAGNYITFISEPKLAATIQAYYWNGTTSDWYMAWGLKDKQYIAIDGFKITGGFRAYNSNNITIKNCEVKGGFHPPSDPSLLWGIAFELTNNGLIQNNYVHSLLESGNSSHNTACIMVFGNSKNNIIENNSVNGSNKEIYSAYGVKAGRTDDNIWRYNFGSDVASGFYGMGSTDGSFSMYRSAIYQNIIINADSFIEMYKKSIDFKVYNNTAYNCDFFIWAIEDSSSGLELWNNISISTNKNFIRWNTYASPSATPDALIDYSDYNADSITNWYVREASTVTYTLAQWVSYTTFGDNSTSTTPSVINAGGTSPEDYKRTAYPSDGRGGEHASVMGAYITGNETIGVDVGFPKAPHKFKIE